MAKKLTFDALYTSTASGELTINAKELRAHVVLGDIIKGATSRRDGLKELTYVYLMSDPKSKYDHLNPDEKHEASKKFVGLDDGWKPSQAIIAGIEYYKEEVKLTPTGKAFGASKKAMYEIGRDVSDNLDTVAYLKDQVTKKMKVIQAKEKEANNEMEQTELMTLMKECTSLIKDIISLQNTIIKQINDLPNFISTVEDLATKWAKEDGGTKDVYGGGSLGNRE